MAEVQTGVNAYTVKKISKQKKKKKRVTPELLALLAARLTGQLVTL